MRLDRAIVVTSVVAAVVGAIAVGEAHRVRPAPSSPDASDVVFVRGGAAATTVPAAAAEGFIVDPRTTWKDCSTVRGYPSTDRDDHERKYGSVRGTAVPLDVDAAAVRHFLSQADEVGQACSEEIERVIGRNPRLVVRATPGERRPPLGAPRPAPGSGVASCSGEDVPAMRVLGEYPVDPRAVTAMRTKDAAGQRDVAGLRAVIAANPSVVEHRRGLLLLSAAIKQGCTDMAVSLLDARVDPNRSVWFDLVPECPVDDALARGDTNLVRTLMDRGVALNASANQCPSWAIAARQGDQGLLDLLWDRKADPIAGWRSGLETGLDAAAASGRVPLMQRILQQTQRQQTNALLVYVSQLSASDSRADVARQVEVITAFRDAGYDPATSATTWQPPGSQVARAIALDNVTPRELARSRNLDPSVIAALT